MERPVSSFQSRKEFVTPSLAKRGLSSGPKPEYFKGGVAYLYIEMSEVENDATVELSKKIMTVSKNVKLLYEMIKTIDQKLDAKANEPNNNNEEKEQIDKIFEKKGIGRPSGDYDTKRKKYCDMLNKGQIKSPKEQTLEYYKLIKGDDGKYVIVEN